MPAANNGCDIVGAGTDDAFAVVCEYDDRFAVVLELVALSAFVLLLRYAVALYYANHRLATQLGAHDDDLPAAAASSRSDGGAASPSPSGLDDAAIAQLPCFVVEMSRGAGAAAAAAAIATSTECAVCLGAVEEGETARALPSCAHAFHARCIDAWLRLRPTCPVCRATCRSPLVLKIR